MLNQHDNNAKSNISSTYLSPLESFLICSAKHM